MKKIKRKLAILSLAFLAFILFLVMIVGGSASGDSEGFSSSAGGLNLTAKDLATKANVSEEKAQNIIDIASHLLSKERFTLQGTSGALAVAERESGFDPEAVNDSGGVAGIFQWSGWSNNINGNRWAQAESRTLSMEVELKLVSTELNGPYRKTKDLVSVSEDPRQASLDWSLYYEGVALSDGQTKADELQDNAQKWYDLLKDYVGFEGDDKDIAGVMSTKIPSGWEIDTPYNGKAYEGSNAYPEGQCTWYVYNRAYQVGVKFDSYMGNGGAWSGKSGYTVSHDPKAQTALSFLPGQAGADVAYGHVAFVEAVKDDGTVLVSEMNVVGVAPLTVSYRVFSDDEAKKFWFVEGK